MENAVYTLVGIAALNESLEVTSDNHINNVSTHENEIQQQDCSYTKHAHYQRKMSADDDTGSNKISIEFITDHKTRDFKIDGNNKKRPVKICSSESDSVASLSANEKVRRKSPKTRSKTSSPDKNVSDDAISSDISKIGRISLSPDVAVPSTPQNQTVNNSEEHAQNAQHGLSLANEALNQMKNSCEILKIENEILKDQISELKEKYSIDVNNQHNILIKAGKEITTLYKKIDWQKEEFEKFENDLVKSKEESIQIYKSLSEANKVIRHFESELKTLKFENEKLQNANNNYIEVNNDIKNKNELLVSENEKLSNKKEIIERENRNYEKEIKFLKNELKNTEKELILNKNEVKKFQSNCKNNENKIHSLENNIKSLQEDKSLILKLNQEVNKNLDECINESTRLRRVISALEDSNRDLKSQVQKLNVKLEEAQGQAKIETNSLRRELNTAKEQTTNLQRQLISNCPTSRNTSQSTCQNSTMNDSFEKLSKDKIELEQELSTYQKKYREIKKLYMQGIFGEKLTKKQSPNKHIFKNELQKLYECMGDFENFSTFPNFELDLSTQLEDPQNRLLIKQVASLIFNERNEYWSEKSKEELEEARRKIKIMDGEIKHLKNNISKATAIIKH